MDLAGFRAGLRLRVGDLAKGATGQERVGSRVRANRYFSFPRKYLTSPAHKRCYLCITFGDQGSLAESDASPGSLSWKPQLVPSTKQQLKTFAPWTAINAPPPPLYHPPSVNCICRHTHYRQDAFPLSFVAASSSRRAVLCRFGPQHSAARPQQGMLPRRAAQGRQDDRLVSGRRQRVRECRKPGD